MSNSAMDKPVSSLGCINVEIEFFNFSGSFFHCYTANLPYKGK